MPLPFFVKTNIYWKMSMDETKLEIEIKEAIMAVFESEAITSINIKKDHICVGITAYAEEVYLTQMIRLKGNLIATGLKVTDLSYGRRDPILDHIRDEFLLIIYLDAKETP